jgi:transcriptional regulator with GAF, ATPase, and Fis domain/uncharacterized protein HemY
MSLTSQQLIELDARLVEIETLFREGRSERALALLARLEEEDYRPDGYNKGLFWLLKAQRAIDRHDYEPAIRLCQEALELLGGTSLNHRIGRLQLLLYKGYAALGDLKPAEAAARDSLASYRRIKDRQGIIDAYNALARVYYLRSDYPQAAEYVQEAIQYAAAEPVQKAYLTSNLGRIYLLTGDMDKAEESLRRSLEMSTAQRFLPGLVADHLSLGYLYLRRRRFAQADAAVEAAKRLAVDHGRRREEIISYEYLGELAFEKQDFVAARTHLEKAVALAGELAPDSALMSQSWRRLAEVELELGYQDEAMRVAQKALDLAHRLNEKAEVALSHRVIAAIFLSRGEAVDARRHAVKGIELLREVGDIFELGRSILAFGAIPQPSSGLGDQKTLALLQEAEDIFRRLSDSYYLAKCHYVLAHYFHQRDKNGEALEYLKESLREFRSVGDAAGAVKVNDFLKNLSRHAIERALSDDNEFKLFGNFVSGSEFSNLKNRPLDTLFSLLVKRLRVDRAFMVTVSQGEEMEIIAGFGLDETPMDRTVKRFAAIVRNRSVAETPLLVLDSADAPHLAGLVTDDPAVIGCLLILPLHLSGEVVGYIYLDRLAGTGDTETVPFSQKEVNFAVGLADLAAFKASEYQKEKLLEDNFRLKAQLLEKCAFPNIITQSRPFMELLARVRQIAASSMAVSITGETGTGKDLLAKAIHYASGRRDKRFISVNCAALPESLLESELFGYRRGAFTGADRDKPGLFEEADGGTFFLDEIADMPQAIQAKLLRVLEDQEITRLGDTKPRKVDVRVLSATNKDLKVEMEERRFRSDLYYRLCALNFRIPALRERKEDIPLLVHHFLTDSGCRISVEAMKFLIAYDWPGNVRELENETKKLVLLAGDSGVISPSLLSSRIAGKESETVEIEPDEQAYRTQTGFSLYDYLGEYEKRFIVKALRENNGVKKRAAESLRIPESTLRLKLKQYNIDPDRLDLVS